jgi:choline-sulfatase
VCSSDLGLPFNSKGEGRDACDRALQDFFGNLSGLPEAAIRNAREVYFALITEFDEYLGKIVDQLDACGLAENTAVFYFSDHGEMAGEHGLWAKVTLLESSVRTPLVVRWPGRVRAGTRIGTPVSLVDLYPTFLGLAGTALPPPLYVNGHSLLPLLRGEPEKFEGQYVFGEFEGEGWNHPRCFIREGRYKYVYNHTADSRLYDLEADPHEMRDLSGAPEHAAAAARLRDTVFAFWDPRKIEERVIRAQVRRKIARNKNVCKDLGW